MSTTSGSTAISLHEDQNSLARRRRRLSAPPTPTQCSGRMLRFHHSSDSTAKTRSLDALDLTSASPTRTLASLRWLILTYLESLEKCLVGMSGSLAFGTSPTTPSSQGTTATSTMDDARQWARTALDMLSKIRSDVVPHFPTLNLELPSSDTAYIDILSQIRSYFLDIGLPHLPDLSQLPTLAMPSLIDEVSLDDARTRFHDIDLEFHPKYIETLSDHLATLREHLTSISFSLPSSPFGSPAESISPAYTFPTLPFASVAEALEALVSQVHSRLSDSIWLEQSSLDSVNDTDDKVRAKTRRMSIVSRGAEFMTDVREAFEANVEAMREQQQEMMDLIGEEFEHMREGFDHMKEGIQENLSHMRDNISHELDLIGSELTAIRAEIGHELDVLKDELEVMALEIGSAVQRSFHGVHLIGYSDLPQDWKNNPFVAHGYRFIPIERWGLIIRSVFEFHNETLNIHTHFIPFLIWFSNIVFFNVSSSYIIALSSSLRHTFNPYIQHANQALSSVIPSIHNLPPWLDLIYSSTTTFAVAVFSALVTLSSATNSFISNLPTPPFPIAITPLIKARAPELLESQTSAIEDPMEIAFMSFALLCLFASTVWHTMSGCADKKSMEFCARCDYIGIGWLISATVATIVYYGFGDCHPNLAYGFLGLCLCTGLMGNIFPFMKWFNMHEYRLYRVAFFISMAFSGLAPMLILGYLHSYREMYEYVSVIFPSLLSYVFGLIFYATHAPERWLPPKIRSKLDVVGGSSHAIWHCFIVLAVSQHRSAIQLLKMGVECQAGI
ncbi:HlyIII-domain-containing protein [Coprinopsis marcescibilis]|uniref:HlyIII-domain-containing protein n=1 Tax=Coprinopsis marcescibilis TaxID=230819 RepID=A0A5C3KN59_COPMA|nr:HlyIII-domain-containing protein [Coprinopsis marcescibilis]